MFSIVATTINGAHFFSEPLYDLMTADKELESYKSTVAYFGGGFVTGYQLEPVEDDCKVLFSTWIPAADGSTRSLRDLQEDALHVVEDEENPDEE